MTRALALAMLIALPLEQTDATDPLRAAAAAIAQAHRQANELAKKDPKAAAALLSEALARPLPPGEPARALRCDLFARISELRLKAADAQGALDAARAGLAEESGRPPTALTAQLKLREGEALEALSRDDLAVDAYSQVIAIAKKLLEERRGTRQP